MNDENVVFELIRQNPEALRFVIHRYGDSVMNLIRRIVAGTASEEDIEECASDVFAKVWNRAGEYDGSKSSLQTWVLVLTKYEALDVRRKLSTKRSAQVVPIETLEGLWGKEQSFDDHVPDQLIASETRREILAVIDSFDETDRQIFYRRFVAFEPIEYIAQSLHLSRRAVDNRLWRGRKKIEKRLNDGANDQVERGLLEDESR